MMTERETVILPEEFRKRMKGLLPEEYDAFISSYSSGRVQGLRFNPLKGEVALGLSLCEESFALTPIPWAMEGFYYGEDRRPGRHPFHEAGVYYIQEPSAMAAAVLLDPQPGEVILDLCAAPGGKTTQIAARMKGEGLLVTNEIHPSRAKILSQNVERMGITNAVVCNEDSGKLVSCFPEFFDRILVDAPCSGEGMFRKDETAVREWSPDAVRHCAIRQQEILVNAAAMLKPGGRLLYSTCTFSVEENENTIAQFLERFPEFSLESVPILPGLSRGRADWAEGSGPLERTMRIWPHKADGEGHFFAVLRKSDRKPGKKQQRYPQYFTDKKALVDYGKFKKEVLPEWEMEHPLLAFGGQLYQLPEQMVSFDGLRVLRPGLHLGTMKKNRFEPSHALALSLRPEMVSQVFDMKAQEDDILNYLSGLGLKDPGGWKGWVLMCVDGYSVGWSKASGGLLKNHYPKGLRRQIH